MQFLNPCNDVAFKKIFGSEEHKQVTISFINSILNLVGDDTIKEVQFLNTEQKRILEGKKDNVLDILCIDQVNNKYIIEVQVAGALQNEIPQSLNSSAFKEACQTANRLTWNADELDACYDAIIKMTDEKGKLEFAEEKGIKKGIERGIERGKKKIAKELLKLSSIGVEDIARATGLTINEIKFIKNDK